ncbi:sporulation integral membrane protein YtvI [Calidifontibacillus oryziterrae]|uniref:sporulation integral membrane protein YtvI n=1 Tax=Calidifontibacillus oryziterrae TaxID=1191699 RepID=UPI000301ACD0|nr:sporulation integral membrane protein YtvI [Calidifontibacillus oryziterrae]
MLTDKTKKLFIITIICFIILLLAIWILPLSIPLVVAMITALFLEPFVKFLEKKLKGRRKLSVLMVFLVFIFLLGLTNYFIVTKVYTEAIEFAENTPAYINEINKVWFKAEKQLMAASEDLPAEVVKELSNQVEEFLLKTKVAFTEIVSFDNITKTIKNIPNYLVSILVYLIALFLIMLELPNLKTRIYNHFTPKTADRVTFMTSRLSYVILGFCKGQLLVSIIIFIVALIGLLIILPEVALTMAFVIWIIDVIPIIGSIIIMLPWSLYLLLTGNIVLGTQIAILGAILLVIRRTVEPKVMGQQMGISPLATLVAMYLGLKLFGILGFIIGPLIYIAFTSAREAGIIKINFKI